MPRKHGISPAVGGHAHGFAGVSNANLLSLGFTLSGTLLLWLRADTGVQAGSTYIWNDQSGQGNNASASSNTPSAPATNSKLNNQLSIAFTASQRLVTGVFPIAPTPPITICVIFSDGVSTKYLIDSLNADTGLRANVNNSIGFTFGGSSTIVGSAYDANGHLFIGLANGASSSERKDNMTTTDVTGTTAVGATGFTIGDDKALGANAGANIAEIMVMNGDLSAGDKTNLRSYFQTRYALTIGA